MARVVPKIRRDRPQVSRSTARREIAAVRQLYRLNQNQERATDVAELERKRRLRGSALMVIAGLVIGAFALHFAPSCTDAASPPLTILIGGVIKVAGCLG
jgi:hypothetical protein